jgi:basic amino acid/polyamine antiporter, APA family
MGTSAATGRLSTLGAASLVIGSMLGTGAFTTSGFLLSELGGREAVLLCWVVGGALALSGAVVYAELGAMLPRVGGEYVYLSRAFHPIVGFLSGWIALLVGFSAPIAAGATAFGRYLQAAWPGAPSGVGPVVLVVLVTALHARDVVWASRMQTLVTGLNLLAMLSIIALGVVAIGAVAPYAPSGSLPSLPSPALPSAALPSPSWGAFAVGLVLVSYSYFGWNAAAYVTAELRDPQRSLPRALLLGCGLVTALYVAFNAILLMAVRPEVLAGKVEVAHLGARALFGETAARVLSGLICLMLAASVSALAMTGPRVYLAMAEDGMFFSALARRNRHGAPTAGALLQGLLALALTLTATFEALLTYVGFTLSLSAAATVLAAVVLRRREGATPRPYRAPAWPLPAVVYFALSSWMAAYAVARRPVEALAGGLTIGGGVIFYLLWRRRSARAGARRTD